MNDHEEKVPPWFEGLERRNREYDKFNAEQARKAGGKLPPWVPKDGQTRVQAGSLPPPHSGKRGKRAKAGRKFSPEFVAAAKRAGLTPEDAAKLTKLFQQE